MRNSEAAYLGVLVQGLLWGCRQDVALGHSWKLDWGLRIWFQESSVISLTSWCWLLAVSFHWSIWMFSWFWQLAPPKGGTARKSKIEDTISFMALPQKSHIVISALSYWFYKPAGFSVGGDYTMARILGGMNHWWPYWMLATKLPVTNGLELE